MALEFLAVALHHGLLTLSFPSADTATANVTMAAMDAMDAIAIRTAGEIVP